MAHVGRPLARRNAVPRRVVKNVVQSFRFAVVSERSRDSRWCVI